MSGFAEYYIERGIEQGIEQGIELGIERNQVDNIYKLIKSLNFTQERAMDVLGIEKEKWPRIMNILKEKYE